MALNYAEKWKDLLIKVNIQETLTSPFITTNVKWLGAKTFHFTALNTSGFKPHNRSGGWNPGLLTQTDHPFTLEHDRDIEFLIDKLDVDETAETASIQNISENFQKTNAAPEIDALFFQRVYTAANTASRVSATALATYTAANVFTKMKGVIAKVKRYRNTTILYIRSELMDLLELSTEINKHLSIKSEKISDDPNGLETRIATIDGVPLMEIIDDERFYSAFDFTEGFVPAANAKALNIVAVSTETVITVPKIASIYYFEPGNHTKGDGYLYQNRQHWDTFIFPNGKSGVVDSIYVDAQA